MTYFGISFDYTRMSPPFLPHYGVQPGDGAGNLLVPAFTTNAGTSCCELACGRFVPLIVNGTYNDPNGEGKTYIKFKMTTSQWCGISVARVLHGNLDGLEGRDDLAGLNPKSGSMRLRIEWPGYEVYNPKINTPIEKLKIEDLARKVCMQIEKFTTRDNAQVNGGPAPEWMIGEGRISINQLVLVSLRRVSVGCWVPTIRLINDLDGV